MKCKECSGRLEGVMTFCPYCGVRQDIDLRQIHFRDLGADESLPCPVCETALNVVAFDTEPEVRVERCPTCFGSFFNPGELEFLLEQKTNPFVWIDLQQIEQIATDFGYQHEIIYRKCPMCAERMSHLNFGGSSGAILDQCGTHGLWVEGGELRRLMEWWRAGGKHIHQQAEMKRAGQLRYDHGDAPQRNFLSMSLPPVNDGYSPPGRPIDEPISGFDVSDRIVAVVSGLLGSLFDR